MPRSSLVVTMFVTTPLSSVVVPVTVAPAKGFPFASRTRPLAMEPSSEPVSVKMLQMTSSIMSYWMSSSTSNSGGAYQALEPARLFQPMLKWM